MSVSAIAIRETKNAQLIFCENMIEAEILFFTCYGAMTFWALMSCLYLLFRRANAIAPDVTSSVRLRRWTAAFFAAIALCHLWYLPTCFLSSSSDMAQGYRIAALLDCMTVIPLTFVVLLTMLQDRQRQLWPVCVAVAPLVVGLAWCVATRSDSLLPVLYVYFLLMWLGVIIYMVCAIRQYGRWLRDNYADLEHKEVWQNFLVLGIFLLAYVIYSLDEGGLIFEYAMEVTDVIVVGYLLWRVETLSDLSIPVNDEEEKTVTTENVEDNKLPLSIRNNIGPWLKQQCEESQLYLQNDISLAELAKQIGTNRVYLSQHFAMQGTTYNAYINSLRIQHFINLYHETAATHQSTMVQQLAYQSGFSTYGTFNRAFKQTMGMTATEWIRTMKE